MKKLKLDELGRLTPEAFKKAPKLPIIIVLDNIRSGMNVGSFFRTADCFAIKHIVLTGISPTPLNKEINKTAIGADRTMSWSYEEDICDAVKDFKKQGYTIIGIEQTNESIPLSEFNASAYEEIVVVFGNEVDGLSESVLPHLDSCIEIEQFGTKHSLNVSVCAGIVMWTLAQHIRQAKIDD